MVPQTVGSHSEVREQLTCGMHHLKDDEERLLGSSRGTKVQGVVVTFQGFPKDKVGHGGASVQQKNVSQ